MMAYTWAYIRRDFQSLIVNPLKPSRFIIRVAALIAQSLGYFVCCKLRFQCRASLCTHPP